MAADSWVGVTWAHHLDARLDHIADVDDPGVLSRFDQIHPHVADA